jgi:hypothetical protein
MMFLQFRNVVGLPTQSPPPSSTTLSLSATTQTSFPVIWIASAIVECGAPLVRDICSTSFNNTIVPISQASVAEDVRASQSVYSQIITKTVVTTLEEYVTSATCDDGPMTSLQVISTVTSTQLSTIYSAQLFNVTLSSKYTTTSFSTRTVFVSASRISEERSYHPSLLYTTGPPSPGGIPGQGLLPRYHTILGNSTLRYDMSLARRAVYDYDSCSDVCPSHDLATNSLIDVCHFVANAQNCFVSLQPISSAAYLPSWLSYVIQTIEAAVEIWAVVSSPCLFFHSNIRTKCSIPHILRRQITDSVYGDTHKWVLVSPG